MKWESSVKDRRKRKVCLPLVLPGKPGSGIVLVWWAVTKTAKEHGESGKEKTVEDGCRNNMVTKSKDIFPLVYSLC